MVCPYLDEYGHYNLCIAKGRKATTYGELRQYCYTKYTECPHYQAHAAKLRNLGYHQATQGDIKLKRDTQEAGLF